MNRKQKGFSLVEVLVAVGLLGVIVAAISFVPALTLGNNTDARTYATNVAREVVDSYRAVWLDKAAFVSGSTPTLPANSDLRFSCTIAAPTVTMYTLSTAAVLETITAGTPTVRQVSVTVSCPRGGTITLSTYVGDPTPVG